MAEKQMIDANGSYTINACDNTGYGLCFGGGIISVIDKFGHIVCEFYAEDAPCADVVEVVRCKDCKYYNKNPYGDDYVCRFWCDWIYPDINDFCSYGERKEQTT